MTNLDRWRLFMRDIESPDIYIDWGFYHLIQAALQRRVWMYSDPTDQLPCSLSLFPNDYIILVGPPSTGKGRVIVQETSILKAPVFEIPGPDGRLVSLIPRSPEKIILEKLIRNVAQNIKTVTRKHPITGKQQSYAYCPSAFLVEELEVLFCQNTNDMVGVMTKFYDAQDMEYDTKHQGTDKIKNVCISMIAGTTPGSIKELMRNSILKKGMNSRCIFIYDDKPRFYREFTGLDQQQVAAKAELVQHVLALTRVFGETKLSPEAAEFAKDFYESGGMAKDRVNPSPMLDDYYGRKKMHWYKLAMVLLYSEQTTSNIITLPILRRAYAILKEAEFRMHEAFDQAGRNEMFESTHNIMRYIGEKGRVTYKNLWWTFSKDLKKIEFEEVMNLLVDTGKVKNEAGFYSIPANGKPHNLEITNERQDDSNISNSPQEGTPSPQHVDI